MNILVTGGASGLGAATVKKLSLNSDHTIYFTYAKSIDSAIILQSSASNIKALHCDFTDADAVNKFADRLIELDVEILINNAIVGYQKDYFHKINPDAFTESFAHNILPVIKITQQFIKNCRKKKFGKIINVISSYVVNNPPLGLSEYVANKAYLLSLSKSWASENVNYNITSNSISPSFMMTGLTTDTDARIVEDMINQHPLKALLTVDEVADSLVYFTNSSQQINGVNLLINAASTVI